MLFNLWVILFHSRHNSSLNPPTTPCFEALLPCSLKRRGALGGLLGRYRGRGEGGRQTFWGLCTQVRGRRSGNEFSRPRVQIRRVDHGASHRRPLAYASRKESLSRRTLRIPSVVGVGFGAPGTSADENRLCVPAGRRIVATQRQQYEGPGPRPIELRPGAVESDVV